MKNLFKNDKFFITAAVIIFIVAIIIGYYTVSYQKQRQETINKINLQNSCTDEATRTFNAIQKSINNVNYTYKTHYNFNLKKCFLLIHGVGIAGIGDSDRLIDIYENKDIIDCESYGTAPELNYCSYDGVKGTYSMDKFNDLVEPYMEIQL